MLSGFGAKFLDYDNDGRIDLFVHNGHPLDTIRELYPNLEYEQAPLLFENTGSGFKDVAAERGEPLRRGYAGLGLATGDYDNDGDTDLLLLNVGARPVLLRNDGGNRRHWIGIALEDASGTATRWGAGHARGRADSPHADVARRNQRLLAPTGVCCSASATPRASAGSRWNGPASGAACSRI